jgi:hypothetical protein
LSAHFEKLHRTRLGAPLYLLEHGLSDVDLQTLLRSTQCCLRHRRVGEPWWGSRSLPLLVAATEVGYAYRGTGTDFWPIFAERLEEIPLYDRQELSHLFQRAANRFGLATPAFTPWNRAFCHIAWPVLHAILPIELHRTLTRALRDVRTHLDLNGSDADLIAPIRHRAHLTGNGRLGAWLEDQRTAGAVVRHFLNAGQQNEIAGSALTRIVSDLTKDEVANADLRDARKRQKALITQLTRGPRGKAVSIETHRATLVLRSSDQGLSLALKIPQLDSAARDAARDALDTIKWRVFLWGQGRPLPSRNVFSDYALPLNVAVLPSSDVPLIKADDHLPLSQEAKAFLNSLRVQTSTPILFSDFSADGDAFQRFSNTLLGDHCIALLADEQAPVSATSLGRVAGLRAYRIRVHDNAAWFLRFGYSTRQSVQLTWLGAPEVEQYRPKRRFKKGSYVAFEVIGNSGECVAELTAPDGSKSRLVGTDRILAGFTADQIGPFELHYGAEESANFEVIPEDEVADLVSVDIDAGAGTIGTLAERQVILRFESEATLQEARVELCLICDGREIARSVDTLADTPCRLTGSDAIWDALLTPEALECLLASNKAELRVHIRGLVSAIFQFEHVAVPFNWERDITGKVSAIDETGGLNIYTALSSDPLHLTPTVPHNDGSHITLCRAGKTDPLVFGGLCIGPKVWHATGDKFAAEPKRLLRQFNSSRKDATDARSVVEALLSWSAADVDHPVTQMRRRRVVQQLDLWLVQQVCGKIWLSRESLLTPRRSTSFASSFLRACANLQVGFANVDLTEAQRSLLDRILLRLIEARGIRNSLQVNFDSVSENLGEALDNIFNDGYFILHHELQSLGQSCSFDPNDDIDVGEHSEDWARGLRVALEETALIDLADLLRPLEVGEILSRADFETMLSDDVIGFLHSLITKYSSPYQTRHWTRELVEASYWIFAKPSVAASLSWHQATQRMLADTFSARVIRYATLRTVNRNYQPHPYE